MYSSFERSVNAKKQLRDKYGKWIFMGGRAKWFDAIGNLFRSGKVTGISPTHVSIRENSSGKTYQVPRASVEAIQAKASLGTQAKPKPSQSQVIVTPSQGGNYQLRTSKFQASGNGPAIDSVDLKPGDRVYGSVAPDGSYRRPQPATSSKASIHAPEDVISDGQVWTYVGKDAGNNPIWTPPDGKPNFAGTAVSGRYIRESDEIDEQIATLNDNAESDAKDDSTPTDISSWTKKQNLGGSTGAALYEDEEGNQYVVKFPTEEKAKNEILANRLYALTGVQTPDTELVTQNGKLGIASPFLPNKGEISGHMKDPAVLESMKPGFVPDAWLANWDFAGLTNDNVVITDDGTPVRVDNGGALIYRAMGAPKGNAFGNEVGELETLRTSPQGKQFYGNMTDEEIAQSAAPVVKITDQQIDELVNSVDFPPVLAESIKAKLKARRDDIKAKIPEAENVAAPAEAGDVAVSEQEVPENPTTTLIDDMKNLLAKISSKQDEPEPVDVNIVPPGSILVSSPSGAKGTNFWVKNADGSLTLYNSYGTPIGTPKTPAQLVGKFYLRGKASDELMPKTTGQGKFKILDDPGTSGDGYHSSGPWGKYGAAGVLIQSPSQEGDPMFLLVQRGPSVSSNKGKWQLPGGALDSKEDAYQGTARETYEELGATQEYLDTLQPVGEVVYDNGKGWQYTNITANAPDQFTPVVDGTETGHAEWFYPDEIQDLKDDGKLHPSLAEKIDELLATFKADTPSRQEVVDPDVDAPDEVPAEGRVPEETPTTPDIKAADMPVGTKVTVRTPWNEGSSTTFTKQKSSQFDGQINWMSDKNSVTNDNNIDDMLQKGWGSADGPQIPEAEPSGPSTGNIKTIDDWDEELVNASSIHSGLQQAKPETYAQAATLAQWAAGADAEDAFGASYQMPDGNTVHIGKEQNGPVEFSLEDQDQEEINSWSGPQISESSFPEEVADVAAEQFPGVPDTDVSPDTPTPNAANYAVGSVLSDQDEDYFKNAPAGTVIKNETDWSLWYFVKNGHNDNWQAVTKNGQVTNQGYEPLYIAEALEDKEKQTIIDRSDLPAGYETPQPEPSVPEPTPEPTAETSHIPEASYDVGFDPINQPKQYFTDAPVGTIIAQYDPSGPTSDPIFLHTKTADGYWAMSNDNNENINSQYTDTLMAYDVDGADGSYAYFKVLPPDTLAKPGDTTPETFDIQSVNDLYEMIPGSTASISDDPEKYFTLDEDGLWNASWLSNSAYNEFTSEQLFQASVIADKPITAKAPEKPSGPSDIGDPWATAAPRPEPENEPLAEWEKDLLNGVPLYQKDVLSLPVGTVISPIPLTGAQTAHWTKTGPDEWTSSQVGPGGTSGTKMSSESLADLAPADVNDTSDQFAKPYYLVTNAPANPTAPPTIPPFNDIDPETGVGTGPTGEHFVLDSQGNDVYVGDIVKGGKNEVGKVTYFQKGGKSVKVTTPDGATKFWQLNKAEKVDPAEFPAVQPKYQILMDANGDEYVNGFDGKPIYVGDIVESTGKTGFTGKVVSLKPGGQFVIVHDPADNKNKPRNVNKTFKVAGKTAPEAAPTPEVTSEFQYGDTIPSELGVWESFPVGTRVTPAGVEPGNGTYTYIKKEDGDWHNEKIESSWTSEDMADPSEPMTFLEYADVSESEAVSETPSHILKAGDEVPPNADIFAKLPVGTVVQQQSGYNGNQIFEKTADGEWTLITDNGTTLKYTDLDMADEDDLMDLVSQPSQPVVPTPEAVPATKDWQSGDEIPTGDSEVFEAFPVGTIVEQSTGNQATFTKMSDDQWHMASDYDNDFFYNSTTMADPDDPMVYVGTDPSTSTSTTGGVSEDSPVTYKQATSAPVGAQLKWSGLDPGAGTIYTKQEDGSWTFPADNGQTYTGNQIESAAQQGILVATNPDSWKTPEPSAPDVTPESQQSYWSQGQKIPANFEAFEDLPIGTIVADTEVDVYDPDFDDPAIFVGEKTGDNEWTSVSGTGIFSDMEMADPSDPMYYQKGADTGPQVKSSGQPGSLGDLHEQSIPGQYIEIEYDGGATKSEYFVYDGGWKALDEETGDVTDIQMDLEDFDGFVDNIKYIDHYDGKAALTQPKSSEQAWASGDAIPTGDTAVWDNFPVGTVVSAKPGKYDSHLIKKSSGQWAFENSPGGSWSDFSSQAMAHPDDPMTYIHGPGETVPEVTVAEPTADTQPSITDMDEFKNLPIGTKIAYMPSDFSASWFVKSDDTHWDATDEEGNSFNTDVSNNAFGAAVESGDLKLISKPEPTLNLPGPGEEYKDWENFSKLPVGTKLVSHKDSSPTTWEKVDENSWKQVLPDGTKTGGLKDINFHYAVQEGDITMPEVSEPAPNAALYPNGYSFKNNPDEFDTLPPGSMISNTYWTYTKQPSGMWVGTNQNSGLSTGPTDNSTMKSGAATAAWADYVYVGHDSTVGPATSLTPATPATPKIAVGYEVGYQFNGKPDEFNALPTGSKVANLYWEYTKQADGTWAGTSKTSGESAESATNDVMLAVAVQPTTPTYAYSGFDSTVPGASAQPVAAPAAPSVPEGPKGKSKNNKDINVGDTVAHPVKKFADGNPVSGTVTKITPHEKGPGYATIELKGTDGKKYKYQARFLNMTQAAAKPGPVNSFPNPSGPQPGDVVDYNFVQSAPVGTVLQSKYGSVFEKTSNATWTNQVGDTYDVNELKHGVNNGAYSLKSAAAPNPNKPQPVYTKQKKVNRVDPDSPWYNAPEPVAPSKTETQTTSWVPEGFLEEIQTRYKQKLRPQWTKDSIEQSSKWSLVQQTISGGGKNNIDSLHKSQLISDEMHTKALKHLEGVEAVIAKEKAAYDELYAKFTADRKAWRAANGMSTDANFQDFPEPSKEGFVGGKADWSKAPVSTHSADNVFAKIKTSTELATHGVSIATDGGEIEDLDVRVTRVIDKDNQQKILAKFKLTGLSGDDLIAKLGTDWTKTDGTWINGSKIDEQSGLVKLDSSKKTSWHGNTYTYEADGIRIEISRTKDKSSSEQASIHNQVRVYMPATATAEDYQKALEKIGLSKAAPATEEDIRAYKVNRVVSVMGGFSNPTKTFTQSEIKSTLDSLKIKYGLNVDDIAFTTDESGHVRLFLPDSVTDSIIAQTKVTGFKHHISNQANILDMITGNNSGALATYTRWQEGINTSGMSSSSDMSGGSGGQYIYTKPVTANNNSAFVAGKKITMSGNYVVLHPKAIARRIDLYGNASDNGHGQHYTGSDLYKLMGSDYTYEIQVKNGSSLADMWFITTSANNRDKLLQELEARGFTEINGIPIEQFVLTEGMEIPYVDESQWSTAVAAITAELKNDEK